MNITEQVLDYIESEFTGDLRQDLYVKILELPGDIPTFEAPLDLEKWVSKIAGNLYKNDRWTENNRARILENNEEDIRDVYDYNSTADDPLDIVLADELRGQIMAGLSDLECDIFQRIMGRNENYKEVATALSMTEEAVRKHMSRIKRKFNGKANQDEQKATPVHSAA